MTNEVYRYGNVKYAYAQRTVATDVKAREAIEVFEIAYLL